MLKAYVLIFGLVALVPGKDQNGKDILTALILAAPSGTEYSWGGAFPEHLPVRRVFNTVMPALALSNHRIVLSAPESGITIPLDSRTVDIKRIFSEFKYLPQNTPKLKAGCLDQISLCKDSQGRPLLAAIVTFTGKWSISAVEVDDSLQPVTSVADDSEYIYLATNSLALAKIKTKLAGALLFSSGDLSQESDLIYSENNTEHLLSKGPCPFSGSNCLYVTISSVPRHTMQCCEVEELDRVDQHLDRIFELFDYSNSPANLPQRFLPFVFFRDQKVFEPPLCSCGAVGYPPAIKCPVTLITQ